METATTGRLKRPTLAAAPLLVLSLMGAGFALWLVLWALWHPDSLGPSFWIPLGVASAMALSSFVLARGCYVDIAPAQVRDVICWVTVQRIDREAMATVKVRPGIWRLFEVTMTDGSVRVLLGASPSQFPARLLRSSYAQDLSDIEVILGE